MERTVLRILGKRGRTTIPWPIRAELDFCPGDVLLFEPDPPDRVIITRMEVYEPEEVEEPGLTGDIFTEAFHKLSYNQQYRLLAALLADFHTIYDWKPICQGGLFSFRDKICPHPPDNHSNLATLPNRLARPKCRPMPGG